MKWGIVIRIAIGSVFLVMGVYFFGPREEFGEVTPQIPEITVTLSTVEKFIHDRESNIPNLKDNNHSRIIWADSTRRTRYVMVYLHGFSASPMEGNPVHVEVARQFGMNLYIPRVTGHGIEDPDAFLKITPADLVHSAKEALAIGRLLGDEIILMSCSTGGTYSIYLAAHHPDLIKALIMYSPNIAMYDPTAKLLTGPWGKFLVRQIIGNRYVTHTEFPEYTTEVYNSNGLIALQALLDQTMKPEIIKKVSTPYFLGYYYKNQEEQDEVISVDAIREFYGAAATPDHLKRVVAFPEAGNHVITSGLHSGDTRAVVEATIAYLEEVLGIDQLL